MKILFFGDGRWATESLKGLAATGYTIVGVVARNHPTDHCFLELARNLNLPIFQPMKVNDEEFVRTVKRLEPDLNLSVSFDQIFKTSIIETTSLGFVNFHAGKLPFYRGRNVINWAILNGETEIGLTAHYVNEGIDTGDIILQYTLPIDWTDTYLDVLENVVQAFPKLVLNAVQAIANGSVCAQSQDGIWGSYFPKRKDGDEWINWADTSRNIYNKIRAITRPGPGSQTLLDDKLVKIWRAAYDPSWPKYLATPGQVVGRCAQNGVTVKTGDSIIALQEVQVADQDVGMPTWQIGTQLGIDIISAVYDLQSRLERIESIVKDKTPF